MIVLWLLISHLVGDYVLQTRWQAAGKFGWSYEAVALRLRHVIGYTAAFAPVAVVYGHDRYGAPAVAFLVWLFFLHFMTDAQRFPSTLGDHVGWWLASPKERADAHAEVLAVTLGMPPQPSVIRRPPDDVDRKLPLPANPWPTIGLALDQTAHLVQIAVLAWVFLS